MTTRSARKSRAAEPEDEERDHEEPVTTGSKKKRQRQAIPDDEDQSEPDGELDNITRRRSQAQPAAVKIKPKFSFNALLKLDAIEAQKLKKPIGSVRVAAPEEAPDYSPSRQARVVAGKIKTDDLQTLVSSTVRLVLARQCNGKTLTGSEIIKEIIAPAVHESGDSVRHLLNYVRYRVAETLKEVFGFELFAGATELKVGDSWHLINSLNNEVLTKLVEPPTENGEEYDEYAEDEDKKRGTSDADVNRAVLMIVLSIIMIEKGEVNEAELISSLSRFGMAKETVTQLKKTGFKQLSIPSLMPTFCKQGYVSKDTRDGVAYYSLGPKTITEIGKRNILLFMLQSCGLQADENDEAALLRI